ncbi:methyltransferase-domain-containing protein [Fomitopsis serialis]|uniref:methyltransferase-domain-containing protein n=1 Tax=Fomitopsis serialis TaxID=139415 RepID=UPI0020089694|nr:methyltransferase-domain-containing protein [Neoantrodia serialis]KAH9938515.1 methyltransferase-domain-containing protein [Neoantrodia serialis]
MPLFDVPGWTVPDAPVSMSQNAKKRKRPSDSDAKLETAHINFEKLMEKLEASNATSRPDKKQKIKEKKSRKGAAGLVSSTKPPRVEGSGVGKKGKKDKREQKARGEEARASESKVTGSEQQRSAVRSDYASPKRTIKTKQRDNPTSPIAHGDVAGPSKQQDQQQQKLTKLQAGLKNSLDGARFRWINEVLYKSDSEHAHDMMRENPKVYEEYHTGFRHQVQSWPTNPVAHYTSDYVIADLGCGDAALARALVPKGFTVLSFDLVSNDAYVIEADTCGRLPLPGGDAVNEGRAGVVDVVVCALSLMGTNWPNSIREAWRVLRPNGELKIAEVASRFTNQDEFVSYICSFGFRLKTKDDSNTHFTLFDFKRVARKSKGEKEWEKLLCRGSILKPCEYKRR